MAAEDGAGEEDATESRAGRPGETGRTVCRNVVKQASHSVYRWSRTACKHGFYASQAKGGGPASFCLGA